MTEPGRQPATTSDGKVAASATRGGHKPDGFAVSPAIGPLPAIDEPD